METFDVTVIGAGPGGYPAAIRAAQLGAKVALIEREQFGGTCLNWGCIPTKTLIAGSSLLHSIGHAESFGIKINGATADYAAMISRKNKVVEKLRTGISMLLKTNGVTVFSGNASFEQRNVIRIDGKKTERIRTTGTVIATGAESAMPKFLPRHERVVESRSFLDIDKLPDSMVVLGGGVIGCEFACMAAQLGVKVTVVEMLEDILMPLDRDVRRELRRAMEKNLGIKVMTGHALQDITAGKDGVSGTVDGKTVSGDMLLVAVGRVPVTANLNLAAAGLKTDERGFIPVDAMQRTAAPGIFAVGDVTGGIQLAHAATAQGVAAAEIIMGAGRGAATLVPSCIFTAPEIGAVGLTEQEAQAAGITVKTGMFPFAALGKAMAIDEAGGFVKWIADNATGRLLGAQAIGPHATELIAEATLAVQGEWTVEELGKTIHSHPTLSEAWMEAAHAAAGHCVHLPPVRKR